MNTKIPFNKPYLSGNELKYISEAVATGKISGDGMFTKKCHEFFEEKYRFERCFLTTSCTDALEMAAILINIAPGDEVIMPSFTFVSTANAFVLRGAKIVFVDSRKDHPGMDEEKIEELITPRTRAIVPVHYAGVACDMHKIMEIAKKHGVFVIEDAAQAIDSFYTYPDGTVKPLGGIGHLAAFSFHETKNVISGEGGMLVINDPAFIERAEIIREKGTNRSKYFRGEIDKYGWVDIGSSFLPSEIIAAFLYAQLESIDRIQQKRKEIWISYRDFLKETEEYGMISLPVIPLYATNNAHMFYIVCLSEGFRDFLISQLKERNVLPVFHYQSLHRSEYYSKYFTPGELKHTDEYSEKLLRLPFYYELGLDQVRFICDIVTESSKEFIEAEN
ncbi:MAG: dTDP-4-amino-4,6-dideoxygalactose transaminase [Chitinophagaceae bacterium]